MKVTFGAIIAIAIIVGIIYFLNTKTGKRVRLRASGTADEVITKDASTPEGAAAYYNTAISKKEEEHQKAYDIYAQMIGKIQTYEEQLRSLQKEKMQVDIKIENCIEKNDDDSAKVYLKRKSEIADKVDIIKNALRELKENSELQKEVVDGLFDSLGELKSEKENAILALETAQVTKSLQATPGVNNSEADKMLEKVRDGVKKTTEKANGNRVAYEKSTEVQQKRLDKKMKDEEIDKELEQLKANRKKK